MSFNKVGLKHDRGTWELLWEKPFSKDETSIKEKLWMYMNLRGKDVLTPSSA